MSSGESKRTRTRRVKFMVRHTWFIAVAFALLCAGLGGAAYFYATLPTQLRISVGPANSEDVRMVQAIAAQLTHDRANIRLQIKILKGGPPAAAAAIDNNQADLAVVRRDSGMPKDGQVVAILRKNVVAFIVPSAPEAAKAEKGKAAAKIKKPIAKIEDMIGKRVGVIGRAPRNIDLLKVILRQYNIAPDKVVLLTDDDLAKPNAPDKIGIVQFNPNTVASTIRESNVDVIMSVGPVGSSITADAIAAVTRGKEPPTFLAIGASEAIAQREPVYESSEIKAGAFGGSPPRPEEDVETIKVHHYIVARKSLGEQTVADFTKHLFAIRQNLTAEMPSAAKIEKPDTDKDAAVPAHPGAAAYLDGELKSFFDRYGDLMFWGVMIVSLFGSTLTGMASYSKADDRVRRLRQLEKLLEIAKAARATETIQAADELQAEIDTVQAGMIQEIEDNTLDQTAMMAFSVSFERAQRAVSDRRAALLDQPPRPLMAVASL